MSGGQNVLHLLKRVAKEAPKRKALTFSGGEHLSFQHLVARIDAVAGGLGREGIEVGDRAVVMVPMSADLYPILLGVLQAGAVAVFLDPWVGRRSLRVLAALAEPQAFLGPPRAHFLRALSPALRGLPLSVTTGRRCGWLPARRTLAELESGVAREAVEPRGAGDHALITFTTGSSGEPKGADRTHGFLVAQHEALREELPYEDDDVDMPMFPVFALNNLAQGVPTVVPEMDFRRVDSVDGGRLLHQMAQNRVTTATASPPFFDRLASALAVGGTQVPRLRRLVTGGAPVSDAQLHRWRRAFPESEIVVFYGSTEAEPVAHISVEERQKLAVASGAVPKGYCVGTLSTRIRARLIAVNKGNVALGVGGWKALEVGLGEVGELVVTGDHVCQRYFRSPVANAANKIAETGGTIWHRMGDTGYFDSQGRFWLVGRVHSTIQRGLETLHPQLVEQAAKGSDERIRRVALVGVPDPPHEERAVLVVETEAGTAGRLDVEARLAEAGFRVDQVVVTTVPLPVDPRHASKVDYGRLRKRLNAC